MYQPSFPTAWASPLPPICQYRTTSPRYQTVQSRQHSGKCKPDHHPPHTPFPLFPFIHQRSYPNMSLESLGNSLNREGGYMCRCRECPCGPFLTLQGKGNHESQCHLLLHERMAELGPAPNQTGYRSESDDDVPGNLFLDSDDETIYSRTNWSDISSVPSLDPREDCDFSREGDHLDDGGSSKEKIGFLAEEDFYSTKGYEDESQDPSEAFHDIVAIDIDPKSPEGMELNFQPIYRDILRRQPIASRRRSLTLRSV